jgi:hypothetical protein
VPDEKVIEQVSGILGMNDIKFMTHQNKRSFLVPYQSAGVYIDFFDWGESTGISLNALVLEQVDSSGERRLKILETLNQKNGAVPFGRFHFAEEEGVIRLDYQLFGDELDAAELMNGLGVIATLADESDDELRDEIGSGVRAEEVWQHAQDDATSPGATGPVVDT